MSGDSMTRARREMALSKLFTTANRIEDGKRALAGALLERGRAAATPADREAAQMRAKLILLDLNRHAIDMREAIRETEAGI